MIESNSSKKVLTNSLIYTMSGLLIKCFGFFLLPLYTAHLTTEDYGITGIASSFVEVMSFIAAFSLFSAALRFYVDLKEDEIKLKRFYGTLTIFIYLSSFLWALLLFAFRGIVSKYVFSGIDFFPIVFVCFINLIFSCQHQLYEKMLKGQQKALKISILSLCYFFINVASNIVLVVVFKLGALGVVISTSIAGLFYTTFFLVDVIAHKRMTFCLDKKLLKEALKYSVPIMPHNLSTRIATLASKVFIGDIVSLASLGIYNLSTQFGNIADTIQTYVDNAYGPWLYEKLKKHEDGYKHAIRKIAQLLASIISLFFIGIALFAQDYIFLFVNEAYHDAWKFIPFIVLGFSFKTTYYFYVEVLFYNKKASKFLFIATLTGSVINVALAAILIPFYGIYGSIIADIASIAVLVTIVVLMSKKYEDIGIRFIDFIINFVITGLFVFLGLIPAIAKFNTSFSLVNFLYKIMVVAVYLLYVFFRFRKEIVFYIKHRFNNKGVNNETN